MISYTLVQSSTFGGGWDTALGTDGGYNLDADPLFVDADGADGISGTLDDDLRLDDYSPAIDAGDNSAVRESSDLDGNGRFYDDANVSDTGNGTAPIVDMGAYERQSDSPAPDMGIIGNGQVITTGDTTPSTLDDTDFGMVSLSNSVIHTLTISNGGEADLTLDGSPTISLTYGTAFTVTQPVSTTLAAGESTTFTLTFAPASAGTFTDTVSIANNDSDENPYTFVISGTGTMIDYYTLTVALDGTGSGGVVSDPSGIDCAVDGGSDCSDSFVDGTVVTLTATAAAGSTFSGWDGACTGTAVCVVTMDEARHVTATFVAEDVEYFIFLPMVIKN